jgi:hypothetical protein
VIAPVVHDATRPGEEHVLGPARVAHAYEPDQLIALCGYRRSPNAPLITDGARCVACTQAAGNRQWVSRA